MELIKKLDIKFHLGTVTCIDINDKYLVSGSSDSSCIIWKLPDFEPIYRLIMPQGSSPSVIKRVALYNDYIVCCNDDNIGVWKLSLDKHQLQFNL